MKDDIREQLKSACGKMILSASGWRGVFAKDGDGESKNPEIPEGHGLLCAAAALVFFNHLKSAGVKDPVILTGMDTRPTGMRIAASVNGALAAAGCRVMFAGCAAAPEIMACARKDGPETRELSPDGFIYISASHNPVGHNGLKFGLNDGGVLGPEEAKKLIEEFYQFINSGAATDILYDAPGTGWAPALMKVFDVKQLSILKYRAFTKKVIAGDGICGDEMQRVLRESIRKRGVAVAADFNGSARSVSIDRLVFEDYGIKFAAINAHAGEIVHRIVPENDALLPCVKFLEEQHKKDRSFVIAYVPDCDGDRGNLVIWDDRKNAARALEAQEVFALCCVSELAHLVWARQPSVSASRIAVVVNDPTSMRVDGIAEAFGAKVFRAETGEANVVSLAGKLRGEGRTVRILGEGSAGGNITHPSKVRDPLSTVFSVVKLLAVRRGREGRTGTDGGSGKGFFEIWCEKSKHQYKEDFTLGDIIDSLPVWTTTGVYEDKALFRINIPDHSVLKSDYQKKFLKDFEERKNHLRDRYGVAGFQVSGYNGIEERSGLADWGATGRGGLKIIFYGEDGSALAALWMRGSATEPVFRIMADVKGDDREFESYLINWQRLMLGC